MNEQITIIYPDNIDAYVFEVTKRDWQGEVVWSEQADTIDEVLEIIEKKELNN